MATNIKRIELPITVNPKEIENRVINGMAIWAAYYRANIDEFAKDYLGLTFLKKFQLIMLVQMNRCSDFVWIASRGMGKTYLLSLFCCIRCILYPGSIIVVTAGTRGQAINLLEKIQIELIPKSPNLENEINLKSTKFAGQDAKIRFKNGSMIKVVTASDNARGNRAHILVVDEYRMVKKSIVDEVLRKFLTSRRMPPYTELTPKERLAEFNKESNKSFFSSSAYFKDSWAWTKMIDTANMMIQRPDTSFVCGLPYNLSIKEGLLFPEDIQSEMMESSFNEISFAMEYSAEFFGAGSGSFFEFDSVSKNRHIKYPMLPSKLSRLVNYDKKVTIPDKLKNLHGDGLNEIRIMSVDVALMASGKHRNDATSIFINQMIPTKAGKYISNIVYTETYEGLLTSKQALIIRKMFDEFDCDYLVLDAQGVGGGVYDALVQNILDDETGEEYPAISCCNNAEMAARCPVPGAPKVIWSVKASAKSNSDCALFLREAFRNGRIRLLCNEFDARSELLPDIKGYNSLDESAKLKLELPYIETTLLINELINLQHEESANGVKIFEKANMRKDRYSSLSYNYYVACQVANKETKKRAKRTDDNSKLFIIRPPSYERLKGGGLHGGGSNPSWF